MAPSSQDDPQAIATRCADVLWRADTATQKLGMQIKKVSPGSAEITMAVTEDMVNGHGTCHGGFLFTLADSAFAFACNTYDQRCVAQHCSISYLAPAFAGEQLLAQAREVSRRGKNGIYDIHIVNEQQETLVQFRGYSRTVKGTLLDKSMGSS